MTLTMQRQPDRERQLSGPLRGLRAIEVGSIGPGPFAAMLLSDMGADVIRLDRIDEAAVGPSPDLLNRGRRSLALDLESHEGHSSFRELVASQDVLLEGFRPGVTEQVGVVVVIR